MQAAYNSRIGIIGQDKSAGFLRKGGTKKFFSIFFILTKANFTAAP
jgi:hypothetical protein